MNVGAWFSLILLNLAGAASPARFCGDRWDSDRGAFWCTLTVLGAAALLNAYPDVLGLVQVVGGAWLLYMGVGMIRGGVLCGGGVPARV
ncbi:putative phage tail protein [Trueperella bonasi]|uniref:Phage tail protein n=1 Tax=Trueperella bonasi TaxID=312286 RepID=A0ABT9NJ83_9ACTO|nr:LysE family transporter [Trueperella bonasi]MDP9806868.1 putative phage tail protein [Trueperella bonasi]